MLSQAYKSLLPKIGYFKGAKRLIGFCVLLACLVLFGLYLKQNPEFLTIASEIDKRFLAIAFCLQLLVLFLYAFRTFLVARSLSDVKTPFFRWFGVYAIGRTLNLIALQSGDLYRAYIAKKHFGLDYGNYGSAFCLSAWIDLTLIFFSAVMLRLLTTDEDLVQHISIQNLFILLVLWLAIAPTGTRILRVLISLPKCPHFLVAQIDKLLTGFWQSAMNPTLAGSLIFAGIGSLIFMNLMVFVVFLGMGIQIEFYQAALLFATYKLSQAISITPGGIGLREISVTSIAVLLGFDPNSALLFALLMRFINLIASSSAALVMLPFRKFTS